VTAAPHGDEPVHSLAIISAPTAAKMLSPIHSPSLLFDLSTFQEVVHEESEVDLEYLDAEMDEQMDPSFTDSGPGAVLQSLTVCSQALAQLQHLVREYQNPPATLEALTAEVRQVARSLSGINGLFYDPGKDVAADLEGNLELQHLFESVLSPTRVILNGLEQELAGIFLPVDENRASHQDTKSRSRYLFTDNVLRDYLSMIRSDRSVLTMLTTALQM
jgi:hypothetical protein